MIMAKPTKQKLSEAYKQTEIGVIPEDWDVQRLGDVAPLQRGFDLPTSQLRTGLFPVVYSNGVLSFHDKAMAKGPGVITGRSGTIGKVHYVNQDYWPHNTTLWVTNFKGNDERYVYFLYSYLKVERFSTGSGVPTLNRNDVHDCCVGIPRSKTEQTAIATTLSDADALIEKTEKLIQKKKNIKQGAMQELLTGMKRLPGFEKKHGYKRTEIGVIPNDWDIVKFGDVVKKFIGGGTPSRSNPKYWNGDIPWVTVKDFATFDSCQTQEYITKEGLQGSATHLIPRGTLIVSTRMALGKAVIYDVDVSINQDLKALVLSDDTDEKYLYYWFQKHAEYINILGGGSTVKGISLPDIKKVAFIKLDKREQSAIAKVLSDMDSEIEELESQLQKYKNIKQGMMQNLLTGKIRLIKK